MKKTLLFLAVLCLSNIGYWALSESVRGGAAIDGFYDGIAVTFMCLSVGACVGMIAILISKRRI